MSDAQLYKQAGNAIVVDVLYYIFKNLIEEGDNKMKQALRLLFAELNYLREKQFLCRQVRKKANNYDEQIELLLKAIEYLEMAIKKGE